MNDDKLIQIPLWVLKHKVEMDFQEFMFFNESPPDSGKRGETFPQYETTIEILKRLQGEGIEFNTETGLWKE